MKEEKLAQRRRDAKGRKRIGRLNQHSPPQVTVAGVFFVYLISSPVFFSSFLLLCAFASLREILLFFYGARVIIGTTVAAQDAVLHQRDALV